MVVAVWFCFAIWIDTGWISLVAFVHVLVDTLVGLS